MARTKGPARESIKRRAVQLLRQRHTYEKHRDGMFNQQFNIDQTKFAQARHQQSHLHLSTASSSNDLYFD